MSQSPEILQLPFTTLKFYAYYVVSQPLEGIVIGKSEVSELVEICSNYYTGKNFVYISHRIVNFSVNPMVYLQLERMKNLRGFGVVSRNASSLNMAAFEKNFSKIPYELFINFQKAQEWINHVLLENEDEKRTKD